MLTKLTLAFFSLILGLSGARLHAGDPYLGFLMVNQTPFPMVLHIGPEPPGLPTYTFVPTDAEGNDADEQHAFHNHGAGNNERKVPLDVNRALDYNGEGVMLEKLELSFTITDNNSEGAVSFAINGLIESWSSWSGIKYQLYLDDSSILDSLPFDVITSVPERLILLPKGEAPQYLEALQAKAEAAQLARYEKELAESQQPAPTC